MLIGAFKQIISSGGIDTVHLYVVLNTKATCREFQIRVPSLLSSLYQTNSKRLCSNRFDAQIILSKRSAHTLRPLFMWLKP